MKLIGVIKNTIRDSVINETKIPDGIKRRLKTMDPKEVVKEMKLRSLTRAFNRYKLSGKWDGETDAEDVVTEISKDVGMLFVPYYDEYDEYARNDEKWDGSDDKYEKIVEVVGQVLFGEYGDEVIRWLIMYFNNMVEEDFYDSYLPPFVKSKPQHKEQYDEQWSPEINKQTIKEQNKEDIINKLIDNDIDPTIIDDLLNSLTDEDINDLVLRNLERKLFKGGNKEKNVRDYFEKYISSLSNRTQQDPNDDFDVEDEFLYGGLEPEQSKIGRKTFKKELIPLQVELLKLQEDVKKSGKPIVVVFEGRDSAGKGSTIKKMVEYLDPKYYNVIALGIATEEEREDWFGRYESKIESGKINFFDRSWYNRGIVEPVMGYSSQEDYDDFMNNVNEFEQSLMDKGIELIKFWLSITPQTQKSRFELRKSSPLKYWKFSPNDEKSIDKWEKYTEYKNKVLRQTKEAKPWTVVDTNDKRIGILNAFRHLLQVIDYEGKDVENIGSIYPEVVTTIKEKENIEGEIPEQWSPELAQDLEAFHNIKMDESSIPSSIRRRTMSLGSEKRTLEMLINNVKHLMKQGYTSYSHRDFLINTSCKFVAEEILSDEYFESAGYVWDGEAGYVWDGKYVKEFTDALKQRYGKEIGEIIDKSLKQFNRFNVDESSTTHQNFNEVISEAKGINEPIRHISRDITNIVKSQNYNNYYLPEDTTNGGELMYDFYNEYKKFGVSRSYTIPTFSIELRYESDLNMGEPYMINGAVMDDDETISIVIIINPNHYPSLMYDLVADINDLVAHEIEHIFQNNNMRPDSEISSLKKGEESKGKEYYKQSHELPAQLKGFKRISKLRKQPIKKVIEDWFSRSKYAHQLSDEDSSKVISHLVDYYNSKYKTETITEGKILNSNLRRRLGNAINDETFYSLKSFVREKIKVHLKSFNSLGYEDEHTPNLGLRLLSNPQKINQIIRISIDRQAYELVSEFDKWGLEAGASGGLFKEIDGLYQIMWDEYSEDLREYIMSYVNEDNPEMIKEGGLPSSVRRRINISSDDDILNDIKVASLNVLMLKVSKFREIINKGFKWAAEEMVPHDEDIDEDYDEYIKGIVLLLKDKYEDDVIEYVTRVIGTFNGPDTHKYTFKKHSERHGGSGFSETFNTWDDLILRFGYWMPLEWDEVKRKLDDKNEGQILISSPGEPTNTMNYYFSIEKISK